MATFKNWNMAEFARIRNSPGVTEFCENIMDTTVDRSNGDLRAAQAARKQPVEDGYTSSTTHGDRVRVNGYPITARAIAHDAVNQSLAKNLPMGTPPPPNHEIPRELGRRSMDAQGGQIGGES